MNQVEVKRKQIQYFSYCLACLTIWIFGKSIGSNGLGYLAAAVLIFELFWILTGKNLPDRMGRMLRGKNAKGQYQNAARLRKNCMLFEAMEGIVGSVLCAFVGWILLEKVFRVPYGSMILWILSPILLFRCIQSAILGAFQSEGSELPSAVSAVLRQVFYLGFGILFSGIFRTYGEKVSLLLKKDDFTSMYGAMGIALGMLISEVLLLLFVFIIYRGSMSGRKEPENGRKGTDSFVSQIRTLLLGMGGDILRQLLLYLPLTAGLFLVQKNAEDIYSSIENYGVFIGRYFVLQCFLVAFFYAGSLSGIAKMGIHFRKKEEKYAKTAFAAGSKGVLVHGFFIAVTGAVLAAPISQVIDAGSQAALSGMLTVGSSLGLWLLLLFYFTETLRQQGNTPLILVGYGILDLLFVIGYLVFSGSGNGLVIGTVCGAAAGALALGIFSFLQKKSRLDFLGALAIPAGSSLACGLLAFGLEKILLPYLGAGMTVLLELVITVVLYWFLLFALHCFREQELSYVPYGKIMKAFGKMCRLI